MLANLVLLVLFADFDGLRSWCYLIPFVVFCYVAGTAKADSR